MMNFEDCAGRRAGHLPAGGRMGGTMRKKKEGSFLPKWKAGGVLAALVAALAVYGILIRLEKNILTQYEKGTVYTAVVEIPKGQMITEENFTDYFREQQLDKSCIPEEALYSPGQVTGLVASFDIGKGVLLAQGMFETMEDILAGMECPVIAGLKAEDLYQVAGGVLRAGDRVNIYSVQEEGARLVWPRVFIQQAFDASGTAIANGDRTTAAQRVNVYLDESEAAQFYAALAEGSLRVVKICE